MTNNRKCNMFGWLATTALLLTTACSDNAALETPHGNLSGSNIVTFTIQPQQLALGTRAEGDNTISISQGQEADVMVFAVYKATKIIEKEPPMENDTVWTLTDDFYKPSQATIKGSGGKFEVADKQNAINVDFSGGKKVTLQFAISDTTAIYKAAFWAQSSQTKAYDTSNLEQVKVNYTTDDGETLNNDELRDAFCSVSESFTVADKTREVVLRRPLAQINVGTAGWDYEGAAYLKPSSVSYVKSQITLDGVAQYYNILTGKALNDDDLKAATPTGEEAPKATTTAVFTFNRIPAFINSTETEWTKTYKPVTNEETLQVHVHEDKNAHEGYYPYVGWEQYEEYRNGTIGGKYGYTKEDDTKKKFINGEHPDTETFKYLSMCYVLVPEAKELFTPPTDEDPIKGVQLGAVLNNVKFEAKGIEYKDKDATVTTPSPEDEKFEKEFTINNVPVQKNWRTNILGYNFFVTTQKFTLDIVPEYFGDYNNYGQTSGEWNGATEIKGGTYSVSFKGETLANATITAPKDSTANFYFGAENMANLASEAKYNGQSYTRGYKMAFASSICFTTWSPATVTIVQALSVDQNRQYAGIAIGDAIYKDLGTATDLQYLQYYDCYDYTSPEANDTPDNGTNVRVYTIKIPAGNWAIKKSDVPVEGDPHRPATNGSNATQPFILYVEVKTEDGIFNGIKDKDNKYEHPNETY